MMNIISLYFEVLGSVADAQRHCLTLASSCWWVGIFYCFCNVTSGSGIWYPVTGKWAAFYLPKIYQTQNLPGFGKWHASHFVWKVNSELLPSVRMVAAVGMQNRGILGTSGILLTCYVAAADLFTLRLWDFIKYHFRFRKLNSALVALWALE